MGTLGLESLPGDAMINYVFPNNEHVFWSVMIVIYPYITGLVAGAFVVSGLSHVFNVKEFKPIGNFALIAAFCFGLFAAVPLLFHLGQPQRAYEIYATPHLTSAMSIFGYVYGSYMVVLMLEIWLIYRPFFIKKTNEGVGGLFGLICRVLTLGVRRYTPESAHVDHKFATILAGIGIPWAFTLHGYVGFIFGSVKSIAWWATPLQPIIFLMSAVVSGMAMLMLMYCFIMWKRNQPFDMPMIRKFVAFLWGFFILDFVLEMLEIMFAKYEHGHHWEVIYPLLTGPTLKYSFIYGQVLTLSVIPVVILGFIVLKKMSDKMTMLWTNVACFLLVMQVLFMRFNVVIGGQLISKSDRGFVAYHFEVLGREGLIVACGILSAPFIVYFILNKFIPIFEDPAEGAYESEPR